MLLFLPLTTTLFGAAVAAEAWGTSVYYFGDLHVHTGYSGDGGSSDIWRYPTSCGAFADVFDASKAAGLDFIAISDHVNSIRSVSEANFPAWNAAVLAGDDTSAGFVTIPAGELWFYDGIGIGSPLGHRTLLMFGDNATLSGLTLADVRPQESAHLAGGCADIYDWADTLSANFGDILLVPHHPATLSPAPTDWGCHEEAYEPVVEIYSRHGNSLEGESGWDVPYMGVVETSYVENAIDPETYGLQMGFVGGTDEHDTRPGETCALDAMQPNHHYGGGLTILQLDPSESFERGAIRDALVDHRTLTTTGPQFAVEVVWSAGGVEQGGLGASFSAYESEEVGVRVTLPSDEAAFVTSVDLVGPTGTYPLSAVDETTWVGSAEALDLPGYLYARVSIDGDSYYGSTCSDGGTDNAEIIWSSPSYIDWVNDDADADGVDLHAGDCDDANPSIFPGAEEVWYDGIDSDCSGDCDFDQDGDTYKVGDGFDEDCNDEDATVSPAAADVLADGVDNDCDGVDGPDTVFDTGTAASAPPDTGAPAGPPPPDTGAPAGPPPPDTAEPADTGSAMDTGVVLLLNTADPTLAPESGETTTDSTEPPPAPRRRHHPPGLPPRPRRSAPP